MKNRVSRMSERGVASLMVTTVLILVIGLIVIGFSQVSQRNQRETLDRQLSTQAFYAAESAVNSVQSMVRSMPVDTLVPDKNDCSAEGVYSEAYDYDDVNASVKCLIVQG